jgi:hypothetical protein
MRHLSVVFMLMLVSVGGLWADLDDFQEDVERTEEISEWEEEEDSPNSPSSDSSGDCFSSCLDVLCSDIFWQIFTQVWALNNLGTTYEAFPYAEGGFMHWDEDFGAGARGSLKDHWYEFSVQGVQLDTLGNGTWVTLEGHFFRFFGPYLEFFLFPEGSQNLNGQRIGLNLALFQSDPLTLSFYGQLTRWGGILERSGGTFGVELKSFPFQPVFMKFRAGAQVFESFNVAEVEVELGFMIDRFSLNGGWRFWDLGSRQGTLTNRYNGPFVGLGVYF